MRYNSVDIEGIVGGHLIVVFYASSFVQDKDGPLDLFEVFVVQLSVPAAWESVWSGVTSNGFVMCRFEALLWSLMLSNVVFYALRSILLSSVL